MKQSTVFYILSILHVAVGVAKCFDIHNVLDVALVPIVLISAAVYFIAGVNTRKIGN